MSALIDRLILQDSISRALRRESQTICSECDNPVRCQSGCTKNREAVPMRVVVDGVLMTHKDIA